MHEMLERPYFMTLAFLYPRLDHFSSFFSCSFEGIALKETSDDSSQGKEDKQTARGVEFQEEEKPETGNVDGWGFYGVVFLVAVTVPDTCTHAAQNQIVQCLGPLSQ